MKRSGSTRLGEEGRTHRVWFRRSRRVAGALLGAFALLASGAVPLVAAESGQVLATVTATGPCITVEASTVDFGTNTFSTTSGQVLAVGTPNAPQNSQSYALTNCSDAEESFLATGENMLDLNDPNLPPWALDDNDTASGLCIDPDGATNRYRMTAVYDADSNGIINDGTEDFIFLSTGAKTVPGGSVVAGGGAMDVGNEIVMPCAGSDGADALRTAAVTYTAVLN